MSPFVTQVKAGKFLILNVEIVNNSEFASEPNRGILLKTGIGWKRSCSDLETSSANSLVSAALSCAIIAGHGYEENAERRII